MTASRLVVFIAYWYLVEVQKLQLESASRWT
jgi:hypothetical protein